MVIPYEISLREVAVEVDTEHSNVSFLSRTQARGQVTEQFGSQHELSLSPAFFMPIIRSVSVMNVRV